jgi:hypothetical protein
VRYETLRLTCRPHFDTLSQAIAITLPTIMLTKGVPMDVSKTTEDFGHAGLSPVALLLYTDLMFGSELQAISRKAGFRPVTVRPGSELPAGDIMVVDLAARGDWELSIKAAVARKTPVVAFGPHIDADARRKAKEAGASRVLSNGNLARDLPNILKEL